MANIRVIFKMFSLLLIPRFVISQILSQLLPSFSLQQLLLLRRRPPGRSLLELIYRNKVVAQSLHGLHALNPNHPIAHGLLLAADLPTLASLVAWAQG